MSIIVYTSGKDIHYCKLRPTDAQDQLENLWSENPRNQNIHKNLSFLICWHYCSANSAISAIEPYWNRTTIHSLQRCCHNHITMEMNTFFNLLVYASVIQPELAIYLDENIDPRGGRILINFLSLEANSFDRFLRVRVWLQK